ncbi:9937_t:CDS:1, partial [Gigaspora margarita]
TPYNSDFSIFSFEQQYATTFGKPILLHTLNELAFKANQKFAQLNNTETTTKRTAFYLYSHIKAYFKAIAQNDNISELGLEQVLEKTIVPTIDPHILARIILYYNIQSQLKFSIAQIKQSYEQEYLIQAKKFIIKHYQIKILTI